MLGPAIGPANIFSLSNTDEEASSETACPAEEHYTLQHPFTLTTSFCK